MARLLHAVACLSLASGALSASLSLSNYAQLRDRASGASPCAQVRDLSAAFIADPANGNFSPTVPAELAYECLTSVPFRKDVALTLVDQVVLYSKFASTVSMAKNPPPEYRQNVQPPYDLMAALANVRGKVLSSSYKSEFEFSMGLVNAIRGMHDEFFSYVMDIHTAFLFLRTTMIVSVSVDGKLPEIYSWHDLADEKNKTAKYKPSAITHINGQPATAFLEKESKTLFAKDPDAAYNKMMSSLSGTHTSSFAMAKGAFAAGGDLGTDYPGPTTTYRFANGTTTVKQNQAIVLIPFDGVNDGKSLADLCEQTPSRQNFLPSDDGPVNRTAIAVPPIGYPPPEFYLDTNDAGGYLLGGQYSDVAVLAIGSIGGRGAKVFQDAIFDFITKVKAQGKKKLIIDLSSNTGGNVPLAYDLYKMLFPSGDTSALADRFRAFNITELMVEYFSELSNDYPRSANSANDTVAYVNQYFLSDTFNKDTDMDINGKPFKTWQQKFGPDLHQNDDAFSSLFRWNFSDPDVAYFSANASIHGFGSLAAYVHAQQPFKPSDIIIVSDGQVGGATAVFTELMRKQGAKFVSIGGRSHRGKMQVVGNTASTGVLNAAYISATATTLMRTLSDDNEAARLNRTDMNQFYDTTLFDRLSPGNFMGVPYRNGYRVNDKSNIPIHFKYTPAECRMFYTKAMALDMSAVWEAVADSAWGTKCHCVDGSLRSPGQKSSLLSDREYQ
ncbi:Peptidase-S41 domain-containing protein [Pyrenophora tritici-repentis]|nr:Peptidase-S41 domain-containing protein [Pyrenophora tritici-repentis]